MIHVIKKFEEPNPCQPVPGKNLTELEVLKIARAFKSLSSSYDCRIALQTLAEEEHIEKLIVSAPALSKDPVAVSIIRDPELLLLLSNPDTVRKVAELHPSLINAVKHIISYVHELAAEVNPNIPGTSYGFSFDEFSDDEDMDSSSSEGKYLFPFKFFCRFFCFYRPSSINGS